MGGIVELSIFGTNVGTRPDGAGLLLFVLGPVTAWVSLGLLGGFGQWIVLRRRLPISGWWVFATWGATIPAFVGSVLINILVGGLAYLVIVWRHPGLSRDDIANLGPSPELLYAIGALISGAAGGAIVGLVQAAFLREYLPRVRRWVLASALGTALVSTFVLNLVIGAPPIPFRLRQGASGLLAGAGYGAVTGLVLVWLLREREPRQ